MTHPSNPPSLEPQVRELERRLQDLQRGLRQRFMVHGFGWIVAAVALALLAYFALDRLLDLPAAVRIILSLALVAYAALQVRSRLLYPLSVPVHRDDMAVAMERRFPELREGLISSVQLNDLLQGKSADGTDPLRNQSPAMIAKMVEEASQRVRSVPVTDLWNPARTRRVWGVASASAIVLLVVSILNAEAFAVFTGRFFGGSGDYPRQTHLFVELPEGSKDFRITRHADTATLTMAAGADLPVLVRAEGVVPREVFLMVSGGRGLPPKAAMNPRGPARFRHVFRRVQSGFSFFAAGGDDDSGDLRVTVETVRPPRVQSIRATIHPPEYTAAASFTQSGGAIEALEGSRVELQLQPNGQVDTAVLSFLESGQAIPLTRTEVTDDDGTIEVFDGEFVVTKSDRYQIELMGSNGLKNPRPGTYPLVSVSDHTPIGRILTPTDDSLSVALPEALIPLRIHARDDYGLTTVAAHIELSKLDDGVDVPVLEPAEGTALPTEAVATELFDALKLPLEGATVAIGDTITIGAALRDNRQPEPQVTTVPGRQIHIVGNADLARRTSGHFRRIREDVDRMLDSQLRLQERLAGLLETSDAAGTMPDRGDLTALQVGQARLTNRAKRMHAQFMQAYNLHLFNRLEDSPHVTRILDLYVSYHRENPSPEPYLASFYTQLDDERKSGRIGSTKVLDPILDMTLSAGLVAKELGPGIVSGVDRATVAGDAASARDDLASAAERQADVVTQLRMLESLLQGWNEFQDVIIQTSSILDKQREIRLRTKTSVSPEGNERK